MEIDITPAMNTYVPRSMLMPVGGVDSSSTRTFLPLALHTSSGIYNQKMKLLIQKNPSVVLLLLRKFITLRQNQFH